MSGGEMAYLEAKELGPLLEDAFRCALVAPHERPEVVLRAYFRRLALMQEVVGRDYAFLSATSWNRRSFVVVFHAGIESLLETSLTMDDFYQLLLLKCPDFPRSVLEALAQLLPRPLDLLHCGTLATAFELFWYYETFFENVEAYYRGTDEKKDLKGVETALPHELWRHLNATELSYLDLCRAILASDRLADAIRLGHRQRDLLRRDPQRTTKFSAKARNSMMPDSECEASSTTTPSAEQQRRRKNKDESLHHAIRVKNLLVAEEECEAMLSSADDAARSETPPASFLL